jgi:predicted MFS family arabinose efflux permease
MGLLAVAALVIAFSPWWWTAPMASAVGGFGFFMFHNTLQTQATQMSATARGTAMTMFAATLFAGQSVGVTGAAHWAEVWGSTVVIAVGHGVMVLVGLGFALRLRHRPRESC